MKKQMQFIVAVRRDGQMTRQQKAYWEMIVKLERAQRKRARKAQKGQVG